MHPPTDNTRRDKDPDAEPDPAVGDDFEEPSGIKDPPPELEDD